MSSDQPVPPGLPTLPGRGRAPGRGLSPLNLWQHWAATFDGVAVVTLAALPVAALAACGLIRWRRARGSPPARATWLSLAEVGIVYGTLPSIWITMVPGSRAGSVGAVSLIPMRDLVTMPPHEIVGNLLILAALGFLAPVRFVRLASLWRIVAVAALGSTLIETAQYVLRLDRVSSVDDVLLNALGAGLAALASRRWWARPAVSPEPLTVGSEDAGSSKPVTRLVDNNAQAVLDSTGSAAMIAAKE